MFFLLSRTEVLDLHPRSFHMNIRGELKDILRKKVEGRIQGEYGRTIAITSFDNFGKFLY
jgi:DNA-directed RNA polymerase subunit E'/Rpb7